MLPTHLKPLNADHAWVREKYDEAKDILAEIRELRTALPADLWQRVDDFHTDTFMDGCTTLGAGCACNHGDDPGPSVAVYDVRIVPRSFYMTSDDWHATVTRRSDGKEMVFIAGFLWLLRWKVRRRALDRAFRWSDRYDAKLAQVEEFST